MSSPAALTDGAPLLITGPTGARTDYGGKTALAAWFADGPLLERDLVLFVNVKGDDVAAVLEDYQEVSSVDGVADAMGAGARRIVLTPTDPDWAAVSERVCSFVRELPSGMTKAVVLDEAPELDDDAVLTFVRVLGNGASCKTLLLSQSPTDVPRSVVKNSVPVWVGPILGSYEPWLRANDYGAHFGPISDSHGPYHWSLLLGPAEEDREHFEPVPEKYGGV